MCYPKNPRPRFRSSDRKVVSNHPDYAYPHGKYSRGLKPENNPRAEVCAECGEPKGKHEVYPINGHRLCPTK